MPIEANCLSKYFFRAEEDFGSTLKGLNIGFGNPPKDKRGWLAVVCSQGSSLPIEANCLSNLFHWVEYGFRSTLSGLNISLDIIPKVEERLTGSIKDGTWLQHAHKALVCP